MATEYTQNLSGYYKNDLINVQVIKQIVSVSLANTSTKVMRVMRGKSRRGNTAVLSYTPLPLTILSKNLAGLPKSLKSFSFSLSLGNN